MFSSLNIPKLHRNDIVEDLLLEGIKPDNTLFKVENSKLKKAVLLKATITESISTLTDIELYAMTKETVDIKEVIGQKISIEINYDNEKGYVSDASKKRYFSGTVISASFEVVPITKKDSIVKNNIVYIKAKSTFCLSDYIKTYKTYTKKKPDEVIKKLLTESGVTESSVTVTAGEKKELITQYDETNFEFISRLMEENGYYYYFTHEKSKDKINIVDKNASCKKISTKLKVLKSTGFDDFDNVFNLARGNNAGVKEVSLTSYDVKTAKKVESKSTNDKQKKGKLEIFDIAFSEKSAGDKIAKLEVERNSSFDTYIVADSFCCEIGAGTTCDISESEDNKCNGEFFIVSAVHNIDCTNVKENNRYINRFLAIKKDVTYRPPIRHPKPVKHGSYIGKIVDSDEKTAKPIDVDDDMMVLVQFPFGLTSRVRYTNISANNKFGANCPPRPGAEVLVIFANGDIDNPVIIGSLYNGVNKLHEDVKKPEISSFTTLTIYGEGYNQVLFDDTKDKERIEFTAEKDWNIKVKNGDMKEELEVGNRTVELKNSDKEVKNELKIKKGSDLITLEEGHSVTKLKKGNLQIEITEGNQEIKLKKGNYSLTVSDGTMTIEAKKAVTVKCGDALKIEAEKDVELKTKGKFSLEAQKDIELKSKANVKIEATSKCSIKATQDLEAQGMNLKLKSDVNAEIKAGVQLKVAGTMANIEASAMLGLKGAIVNVG